ncbi:MAG: DUF1330 domain-containing protein [Mesorhizobium sp.]|uniref:DUF1330 domain-containing protein n=2 Tax=Mesorhizobium sp. TaxID=1871066 RepID=UPI000FE618C2|nr:DUF1330 domain-containing protein [Mesorhizobium sp.]RWM19347.1 MAG: DUF1330 domain-containing protein [Mesorhizobium sp.]TIP73183.1 MAG: DUF1330 domain-containing protein [Mesorhizobium sp.]TIQ13868.1 MAG: DUF1330 domain-containing protein [Mesorhizobium sp.]TIR48308.1 MAG: DUF1330 domain-containing protein [Mesorhizobium sp.]TJV98210.1 MAG: DUF1330 domain-containing protein [Mesorhizobium sp.]
MPAYVFSDVTIRDNGAIEAYRTRATASIAQHGGRYLVRGGQVETLEGNWNPGPLIVVEFPDMEQARRWYGSAEYAAALEMRDAALSRNLVMVDGIAP